MEKRDIASWRIYGDKQVTVSIRFDETPRGIKANHGDSSTCILNTHSNPANRCISPPSVERDKERLANWAGKQGGIANEATGACRSTCHVDIDSIPMFTNNPAEQCYENMLQSECIDATHESGYIDTTPSTTVDSKCTTTDNMTMIDIDTQCCRYDILTHPFHDQETQTSRKHKSRNVQALTLFTKDVGTDMSVSKRSFSCVTEKIETIEKGISTYSNDIHVSTGTDFVIDKSTSASPTVSTTSTSTSDLEIPYSDCQIESDIGSHDVMMHEEQFYKDEHNTLSSEYHEIDWPNASAYNDYSTTYIDHHRAYYQHYNQHPP